MNMQYMWCVVGPHFSGNLMQSYIRTSIFGVWWGLPFQWEPHAIIHSNMHYFCVVGAPISVATLYAIIHSNMHYLVCGGGPHFSGNLMQSYIRTSIFGVWWGPPFQWEPHAIINSNTHYLVCGGGPHFSGNLMQS